MENTPVPAVSSAEIRFCLQQKFQHGMLSPADSGKQQRVSISVPDIGIRPVSKQQGKQILRGMMKSIFQQAHAIASSQIGRGILPQ